MAIFVLVFHVPNTICAWWSAELYNAVQDSLRLVYHNRVVESLLLGALTVHAIYGIRNIWHRGWRTWTGGSSLPWSTVLHRASGLFLLVTVFFHVAAVRFTEHAPRAEGVIFTLRWGPLWFVPYYSLLGICGVLHGVIGVQKALGVKSNRMMMTPTTVATIILCLSVVATIFSLWLRPVREELDLFALPYAKEVMRTFAPLRNLIVN